MQLNSFEQEHNSCHDYIFRHSCLNGKENWVGVGQGKNAHRFTRLKYILSTFWAWKSLTKFRFILDQHPFTISIQAVKRGEFSPFKSSTNTNGCTNS